MDVTLALGWWLVPTAITVTAFVLAHVNSDRSPAYDYGKIGQAVGNALITGVAIIVSLIAWLVYAFAV